MSGKNIANVLFPTFTRAVWFLALIGQGVAPTGIPQSLCSGSPLRLVEARSSSCSSLMDFENRWIVLVERASRSIAQRAEAQ